MSLAPVSYGDVLRASRERTAGGLTADMVTKNKMGKLVCKTRNERAKQRWTGGPLQKWGQALAQARKEHNITGFLKVNSPGKGEVVYKTARDKDRLLARLRRTRMATMAPRQPGETTLNSQPTNDKPDHYDFVNKC